MELSKEALIPVIAVAVAILLNGNVVPAAFAQPGGDIQIILSSHYQKAQAAQARQDYHAAIAEWKAIVKLAPAMAEAHSNLGMMCHFARRPFDAIPPFREAIRLSPKLVAPHLFLGISYYLVSRPSEAVSELRQALELEPTSVLARKWLGVSYLFGGELMDGIATLIAVREQDPGDSDALFQLARAYGRLTVDSLRRIHEAWPDSAWDHLIRGEQNRVQGQTERARRHFREAARIDPNLPDVATAVAELEGETVQPVAQGQTAFAVASEPIKDSGNTPAALYRLAGSNRQLAFAAIEEFGRREPDSYRLLQLRAEYEESRENYEAAEAQYRRLLGIKPDALHAHLALGNIYANAKRFEEAISEYRQELRIDRYSAGALVQLGRAHRHLQENEPAIEVLKHGLAIDPRSGIAHKEIGIAYLQAGSAKLAIDHLQQAHSLLKGSDSTVLYQLGRAYRLGGQPARASQHEALYRKKLEETRKQVGQRTPH